MMNLDKSEKVQMVIGWTCQPTNFPSEARNIRLPASPLYPKGRQANGGIKETRFSIERSGFLFSFGLRR